VSEPSPLASVMSTSGRVPALLGAGTEVAACAHERLDVYRVALRVNDSDLGPDAVLGSGHPRNGCESGVLSPQRAGPPGCRARRDTWELAETSPNDGVC
jgi:hypothetical protein